MQLYVVGTADSVRIREVSLTQSALYREVPQYTATTNYIHQRPQLQLPTRPDGILAAVLDQEVKVTGPHI